MGRDDTEASPEDVVGMGEADSLLPVTELRALSV